MEKSRKQKEITDSVSIIESSHPSNSAKPIKKPKKQLVDKFETLNSLMKDLELDTKRNELEWALSDKERLERFKNRMSTEISQLKCFITEFRKSNEELRNIIDSYMSKYEELTEQNILFTSQLAIERGQKLELEATNKEQVLLDNKPKVMQQNIQQPSS